MREPEHLAALQARLGVTFHDHALLEQALRHRSVSLDRPDESNERLEFLGDAILGMVVCEELFARFPEAAEGQLAKAKAHLVSEPTLAKVGQAVGLERAVELSQSEEAAGGRLRRSIVADALEAVIAAVYLDQGIRTVRALIRRILRETFLEAMREEHYRDFKSLLQERLQATTRRAPRYRIVEETGAQHDKTFVARALSGARVLGEGTGKSKKQAEQEAARAALEALRAEPAPRPGRRSRAGAAALDGDGPPASSPE